MTQIDFMHTKLLESTQRRYSDTIRKFDRIEHALHPFNGPQERSWNPFYFFNQYGASFGLTFYSIVNLSLMVVTM